MRSVSETLAAGWRCWNLRPSSPRNWQVQSGHLTAGFGAVFPTIHGLRESRARSEWFNAYVSTFLERDLPALGLGCPHGGCALFGRC